MSNIEPQQQDGDFPLGLIDKIMDQLPLWVRTHLLLNWGTTFANNNTIQDPAIIKIFGTVTTLNFHHYLKIDATKFLTLGNLPFSSHLAHLDLSESTIGEQPELVNFLSHPIFQHLVTLDLSYSRLESLDELFINTAHNFPNLCKLDLGGNYDLQISSGFFFVIPLNKFPQLKVLKIQTVRSAVQILTALLSLPPPRPQQRQQQEQQSELSPPQLQMSSNTTTTTTTTTTSTTAPTTTIAPNPSQSPTFRLEKLILGSYQTLPLPILNSPCLSQLQELSLVRVEFDVSDIHSLFGENSGTMIKHLTLLNLGRCKFKSYEAFKALTESPCLANLHTLVLYANDLPPPPPSSSSESTSLEVLIKSPYLWTSKLKHLSLAGFSPPDNIALFTDLALTALETANVRFETFSCNVPLVDFNQLTTSPCFSQLKTFPSPAMSPSDCENWDTLVEKFAQSPNLSNLTSFEFYTFRHCGHQWTHDQIVTLLTSPMMSNNLIMLRFPPHRSDIYPDSLLEVLTTERVVPGDKTTPLKYGKLQKLYLGNTQVACYGVGLIVQNFPQLTHLDLHGCENINNAAINALIAHEHDDPHYPYPALPNLVVLGLKDCSIRKRGCIALSKSQLLDQLEQLSFGATLTRANLFHGETFLKTPLFSRMKLFSIQIDPPLETDPNSLTHFDNCIYSRSIDVE